MKGVANVIEYRSTSYKLLIVEGREEVIPFVLRIKGSSSVKSKSIYLVGIDISLSMDGAKIFYIKEAVIQILRHLNPENHINVYSFNAKYRR